mmetsp:Transcript_18737/g.36438  ORF Transcript_18737/g.36438 Transcript_18737/m.36438 type:complete len:265 (-) Transcript_18737:848-1642(-)
MPFVSHHSLLLSRHSSPSCSGFSNMSSFLISPSSTMSSSFLSSFTEALAILEPIIDPPIKPTGPRRILPTTAPALIPPTPASRFLSFNTDFFAFFSERSESTKSPPSLDDTESDTTFSSLLFVEEFENFFANPREKSPTRYRSCSDTPLLSFPAAMVFPTESRTPKEATATAAPTGVAIDAPMRKPPAVTAAESAISALLSFCMFRRRFTSLRSLVAVDRMMVEDVSYSRASMGLSSMTLDWNTVMSPLGKRLTLIPDICANGS